MNFRVDFTNPDGGQSRWADNQNNAERIAKRMCKESPETPCRAAITDLSTGISVKEFRREK